MRRGLEEAVDIGACITGRRRFGMRWKELKLL